MEKELLQKVEEAIVKTGFPLELEVGALLEKAGWIPFHSVEYRDPFTQKNRELDILSYKLINNRRIELRISCKSSSNKQFVFFTRKKQSPIFLNDLKSTPVSDDDSRISTIPRPILRLPFFSHDKETVNFTVVSGSNPDKESRSLLKDAIFSTISSIYKRILPYELLYDKRGTIYFFITIIRGNMFEASFETGSSKIIVNKCKYAQWDAQIPIPDEYWKLQIQDEKGNKIPFTNVIYWFGDDIRVEIFDFDSFAQHLRILENAFKKLDGSALSLFGKDWSPENFPRIVKPAPQLKSIKKKKLRNLIIRSSE